MEPANITACGLAMQIVSSTTPISTPSVHIPTRSQRAMAMFWFTAQQRKLIVIAPTTPIA